LVGITASASDGDSTNNTVIYKLTDSSDGRFTIDPVTGVVTIMDSSKIDYETATSHNITVEARSSDGSTSSQTFLISVADANDLPTSVSLNNSTVDENTDTAVRIKVADIKITDDALGNNIITLSGADTNNFEVDGTTLYLKANIVLDYEIKNSYAVTVSVDDVTVGSSPDVSANFKLTVTDINEAASGITLNNQILSIETNTNTDKRIKVADIDISDDILGSNIITLSGADANSFEVEEKALYLKAGTALNFINKSSYEVLVNIDDITVGSSRDVSANFKLTVTDVNKAPTEVALTNTVSQIAENTSTIERIKVADIKITDDGLGSNILTLSGADASSFEVDGADLYLKAGITLNYESKNNYAVTVNVNDARADKTSVSTNFILTVSDVNQLPTVVALTNTVSKITENTSTNERIKVADIRITDDALGSNILSLSGADASSFEVDGTNLYLKAGTVLNYEAKNSYAVTVNVDDPTMGKTPDLSADFILSLTDVNEPATAVAISRTVPGIDENTLISSSFEVASIRIRDDALGDNSIGLSGKDASRFELIGEKLYLKSGTILDYETKNIYTVTVNVDDPTVSNAPDVTGNFTLAIIDINEAPTGLTLIKPVDTIDENTSTRIRIKVADIAIIDDELGRNTITLTGTDADKFDLVGNELYLKAGTVLNYEAKSSYALTVTLQDASLNSPVISANYLLRVNNVNESPTSITLSGKTVLENGAGLTIGEISVKDPDDGDSYSLTVNDKRFEVVNNSLQLKADKVLDYKQEATIPITITATDKGGLTRNQNFTLNVIQNQLPKVSVSLSNSSVEEDEKANLAYTFTRTGVTAKGLTVNYDLSGEANNSDYTGATPGTQTITFAPGAKVATLIIDPTSDAKVEGDKTVTVKLVEGTDYIIDTQSAVTGTIVDDDKDWTRLLGTSGSDYANGISTGSDGSIYVSGVTRGNLDGQTNSGQMDGFIAKYNPDGTKVWSQLLGTSGYDSVNAITTGSDGYIYISGVTGGNLDGQTNSGSSDIFISKYSPDGTKIWTRLLGTGNSDNANAIATGSDGSIYVSGVTGGNLDGQTNSGQTDAFISKYSPDGTKIWTQLLGSASKEAGYGLTIGSDGNVYISGTTTGNLDGQTNSGGTDAFISKYNSDGSKIWTRLLGSSGYEDASGIVAGEDGSIYITGVTGGNLDGQSNNGQTDAFISKYDPDGIKVWTRLLGTDSYEDGNALTIGGDGFIYVSGVTGGNLDGETNSGGSDAFISKYSLDGRKIWTKLLGSVSGEGGNGLNISKDGDIYISGMTTGDLGGQSNSGGSDAFIRKLTADGVKGKTLVVIDGNISGYETLVEQVIPGAEVIVVGSQQDGIEQISQALKGKEGIASLQIISEGKEGEIQLGTVLLNANTIQKYQGQLREWGKALTKEADILLFGCNVGLEQDNAFIKQLSELTGADVAVSNDLTGNAALGGDWDLEVQIGKVESVIGLKDPTVFTQVLPLKVEYFSGGNGLNFLVKQRVEEDEFNVDGGAGVGTIINKNWGSGGPQGRYHDFSVRWMGYMYIPTTGTYKFIDNSDDGARLWINGKQVIDQWKDETGTTSGSISLQGDRWHSIQLDYYENDGSARVKLEVVNNKDELVQGLIFVPLYGNGLSGNYYPNKSFATPSGTVLDSAINFNWGSGSIPNVSKDNVGVR